MEPYVHMAAALKLVDEALGLDHPDPESLAEKTDQEMDRQRDVMSDLDDYHKPRASSFRPSKTRRFTSFDSAYEAGYIEGHLDGAYSRMIQERQAHQLKLLAVEKKLNSICADLDIAFRELAGKEDVPV